MKAVRRQLVLGSPAGRASQPGGVVHTPGGVGSDRDEEESDAHLAVFDFSRTVAEDDAVHTRLPSQEQRRGATLTAAASMAKASLRGCSLPVVDKVQAVPSRIYDQLPPRHRHQQETPVSVLSAANRSLWSGHTGGSVRTSASAASAGDLSRPASNGSASNGSAPRVTVPHYDRAPSPLGARSAEVPPATRTCALWLGLSSWGAASPAAPDRGSRLCSIL
jgi:hypothetical protein